MPHADHQYTVEELAVYAKLASLAYLPKDTIQKYQRTLLPSNWTCVDTISLDDSLPNNDQGGEQGWSSCFPRNSKKASAQCVTKYLWEKSHTAHIFRNNRKKELLVSFRGTRLKNVDDLHKDLNIAAAKGVLLPDEFIKSFMAELADEESYHPRAKLTLVGHSLGGYLAAKLFLALETDEIERRNVNVVGFDSPGIEEGNLHRILRDKVNYRLRFHTIVINPNLINTLHHHPGRMYRIVNDGSYRPDDRTSSNLFPGIPALAEEVTSWFKGWVLFPLIAYAINVLLSQCNAQLTVTSEQVAHVGEIASEVVEKLANNSKEELKNKVDHTLQSHAIARFVGLFQAMGREGGVDVHEIDPRTWPGLRQLQETPAEEWKDFQVKCVDKKKDEAEGVDRVNDRIVNSKANKEMVAPLTPSSIHILTAAVLIPILAILYYSWERGSLSDNPAAMFSPAASGAPDYPSFDPAVEGDSPTAGHHLS